MMKLISHKGLMAIAVLIMFFSFGLNVLNAQSKVPITWWYEAASPENQKNLDLLLVKPFNQSHPAYQLSINYRGEDIDKQLRIAMLSGRGPDIVYTAGPSYVAAMAQSGQLLDMNDYAVKYGWNDRILSFFMEMGKYNGKLYALPKTYETMGIFYDKGLFSREGWTAPKTIDELEKLADAMKAKGIVPFAAGTADWRPANEHYVTLALNSIAGPENIYKALKGEIPWTAEPFVKAISTLNKWWQKGYFGPGYFSLTGEQAFAQISTGKAGMAPTGTWCFQYVPVYFAKHMNDVGFIPFPSADGNPVYPIGIGSFFSIAARSQHRDGAATVIDYMFHEPFYKAINSVWQGEWNMPLKNLNNVQLSADVPPLYSQTMSVLAKAVEQKQYGYTSWTFLPPATDTYLVNGIEEVWLGKQTVEQYLTKLNTVFQKEMSAGKVPAIPSRS